MSVGKFLSGFIIGSTVGGVIVLLLAPRAGEETRELLLDKSEEAYKCTEDSIQELQTKANDVMDEMQQKGDELLVKVQDLIKKQKEE